MIEVTRLNGTPMTVNSDLIKIVEASPDTTLTLIQGEKLIVRETRAEVVDKVIEYRARLLAAVAEKTQSPESLHRLVAITSLNLDSGGSFAPPVAAKKVAPMLTPNAPAIGGSARFDNG
jgi:flagellar protein FlbD